MPQLQLNSDNLQLIQQCWTLYQGNLAGFIRARMDDSDAAEDILLLTFSKLSEHLLTKAAPDNPRAWLFAVARNAIADYYRGRLPLQSYDDSHVIESTDSGDASALPQLEPCLLPFIQSLDKKYRDALLHTQQPATNYQDLARQLNLSVSAVKSRVARARQLLLKKFHACCDFDRDHNGNILSFHNKNSSCNSCELG